MNKNILHTRKATVFVDFYEPVNCVFMIPVFCFGRVVSCMERLDTNSIPFTGRKWQQVIIGGPIDSCNGKKG